MSSNSYEKQRAAVNIGMALKAIGWKLIGFHEDTSDSMTDYYHPASWDGIATRDAYPGVVVIVNANDYTAKNLSGKPKKKITTVPGDTCPTCGGSGVHPDALTYTEALERPEDSHVAIRDRARSFRMVVFGVHGAKHTVDRSDYLEDGRPRCLECYGRGHQLKEQQEVLFVYPIFQANPRGRAWHVEHNGRRIASGTGFAKAAEYGTRGEQTAAAIAAEIEAAAKRTLHPDTSSGDAPAQATSVGQLTTVATAGGVTVHAEHDKAKGWTYLQLTPRVDRVQYDALATRFNVKWHRMRRQPVIYRLIGADKVAAFFGPVADQESVNEPAPAETTPAPTPAPAPAPEIHPFTRIVQLRAEIARLRAAGKASKAEQMQRELLRFQIAQLAVLGIPLAIREMYQSRVWGDGVLAKRARNLRARALRAAGWVVTTRDGAASYLAATNPWFDGAPVQQPIVDVTPDTISQQYQPVSLTAPGSDEAPRPLAAPTLASEPVPEPMAIPKPTLASAAEQKTELAATPKGKGKNTRTSANGPMQQLALL